MHSREISLCRASLIFAALAASVFSSARTLSADSFDWRNVNGYNWNSTIKSQFGGTCWDFAAVGAFESKYMLTRNDTSFVPDLSEEQLCWETDPELGGTGGGGGVEAMAYCASHGVVSETVCPVEANSAYWDAPGPGDPWPLESVFPAPDSWQKHICISAPNSTPLVPSTTAGI